MNVGAAIGRLPGCQRTVSLRASAHTGVAIRFLCLPLGEGGSRVPRKRETDEGKSVKGGVTAFAVTGGLYVLQR